MNGDGPRGVSSAAVLGAGALVGLGLAVGLWLGLGGAGAPHPRPGAAAPPAPSSSPTYVPTGALVPPPARVEPTSPDGILAPRAAVPARVELDAARALARLRQGTLLPKCWRPRPPHITEAHYTVQVAFGADGEERARGISERRDAASPPALAACLREVPLGLKIEPPGQPISVTLELSFP